MTCVVKLAIDVNDIVIAFNCEIIHFECSALHSYMPQKSLFGVVNLVSFIVSSQIGSLHSNDSIIISLVPGKSDPLSSLIH